MKMKSLPLALALACAVFPATLLADESAPSPRAVVDRYIEALGGMEEVTRRGIRSAYGTFSMPAANVSGAMQAFANGRDKISAKVELPGIGEIRSGINGDVVWAMDPFQGPRLLEGVERARELENADPDALARSDAFVEAMHGEGRAEFDGKACWKVRIEWKSGRESWDCYGVDDGLLLASGGKTPSPMGEIETTAVIKEYREIGGYPVATRIEITSMGQQQILALDRIEQSAPDDAVFELPAAIKTLVEQQAAKSR
ncbi:hypothetical protein [Luteimonas sp. e5]